MTKTRPALRKALVVDLAARIDEEHGGVRLFTLPSPIQKTPSFDGSAWPVPRPAPISRPTGDVENRSVRGRHVMNARVDRVRGAPRSVRPEADDSAAR